MSHDRYGDTEDNRVPEKYNPMFSLIDGKNKGAEHKKRILRKLCDTDNEDDAEENHQVLERPARMNNEKKLPAKVSAM